jgi:glycosyltransferase involved in cell wall biosynthesis
MGQKRVLIEGFKLAEGKRDGCFRYTQELLKGLIQNQQQEPFEFKIEVLIGGKALSLADVAKVSSFRTFERNRARVVEVVRIRQKLADAVAARTPFLTRPLRKIDDKLSLTRNLEKAHVGALTDPRKYDLIHLTLPQSFQMIEDLEASRYLVTVHDCTHRLFPEFHTRPNIDASERGMEFSLKKEANFIAVSRSAGADLLELYNIPPQQVTMIYEGSDPLTFYPVSDETRLNQLREAYGIPKGVPYFLTLSTLEPRKNLSNTLRAFSRLLRDMPDSPVHLVIAGRLGWKYDQFLSDLERHRERVIFTDFVPDKDLAALYSGALAFSFVSHYEGFGLPALEAMACGVPVIYGNAGSLPEVVENAGLAANPNDIDQISRCFAALIQDPELRSEMSCRAVKRAAEFSWDTMVRSTVEVYRSLLAGEPPPAVKSTRPPGETTLRPENS